MNATFTAPPESRTEDLVEPTMAELAERLAALRENICLARKRLYGEQGVSNGGAGEWTSDAGGR